MTQAVFIVFFARAGLSIVMRRRHRVADAVVRIAQPAAARPGQWDHGISYRAREVAGSQTPAETVRSGHMSHWQRPLRSSRLIRRTLSETPGFLKAERVTTPWFPALVDRSRLVFRFLHPGSEKPPPAVRQPVSVN